MLTANHIDAIAAAYFKAYPPGIACTTLAGAVQEIRDTFAGEYGALRYDASAIAVINHRVVGAVLVVHRSIWDSDLLGPFIIDLFVDPAARGQGLGKTLLHHAINTCAIAGDEQISLRIGDGTSLAAHALYEGLGFVRR
ncbi:GNAT family N-acetyltransferase [Devriesea agamarum]|uniref:GNAT family N-acetyltransferase n=1 Tax=Devriesea agamarum TaxID=472569 RepID=UPI00071DEC0A|nr:GNAT family N-acetyltransferase [Devriesea agamarum]